MKKVSIFMKKGDEQNENSNFRGDINNGPFTDSFLVSLFDKSKELNT